MVLINPVIVKWDVSESWRLAATQYDYFSDPGNGYINGEVIKIDKGGIKDAASNDGIQAGDLMYFAKDAESAPHHATIISKIDGGDIYYAGNTESRFDKSLSEVIGDETVFIIRIFDNAE